MDTVARYATSSDLALGVAERLMRRLEELQIASDGPVHLCLTGGNIANRIYESFTEMIAGSGLDPDRIVLWWGDERFVPTEDPDRHAGRTLSILARTFALAPGQTHPMPAADGVADNDAAAATYAKELGDTAFDICLMGIGKDGHTASLFPNHPSFDIATTHTVIGVSDSPKPPAERISLTVPAFNRSREVWYLVSGANKANAVARAHSGDPSIPSGVIRGAERTLWLLDREAAAKFPYHECSF
ncbi:MAG: 6-phosphogluconolactonase [Propioniciclava sp.]|uniref:6-phosphogluconolactonase n=1 Tax=Propioniciclava sp. TaxID=2038686 RepID=UPI0039E67A74